MSFNICSISGNLCEIPVITKDGHVFEKRLIEKVIETTGQCPITGEALTMRDLIDVKCDVLKKPRNVSNTSVPAMFGDLQGEWDGLILETFNNKKQLEMAKQELSHALYRYDAACRVIANLAKERDMARDELLNLKLSIDGLDEEGMGEQ
jgi:pre-mRNA-processing factor 19